MLSTAAFVGTIVAKTVLERLDIGTATPGAVPMVRVKNLERDEITHAAASIASSRIAQDLHLLVKIAENEPWPGCPDDWFLVGNQTRAGHRNQCKTAFVLFDYKPQPDDQSLKNMHAIHDRELLGVESDDPASRRALIAREIWVGLVDDVERRMPEQVATALEEVFRGYSRANEEIALRTWVSYVAAVVSELMTKHDSPLAAPEIEQAIGACLPELRLFPDRDLFARTRGGAYSRVVSNACYAGLRTKTGRQRTEEDVSSAIDSVRFVDTDGRPFSDDEAEAWRDTCRALLYGQDEIEKYRAIPYYIWAQLFEKEASGKKLGDLIRDYIEENFIARIQEFDDLDVTDGLNDDEQAAAEILINHVSTDIEERPIFELLPRALRRALEKLAFPDSPTTNDVLAELLRRILEASTISTESGEAGGASCLSLKTENGDDTRPDLSLTAFRFLYACALVETIEGVPPGGQFSFVVANELIDGPRDLVAALSKTTESEDGADDAALDRLWAPIRLVLEQDGKACARFSWNPDEDLGRVALVRLVCNPEAWTAVRDEQATLDEWSARAREPGRSMGLHVSSPLSGSIAEEWFRIRVERFASWRQVGISAEHLSNYADEWLALAERARTSLTPRGAAVPALDAFLDIDMARLSSNRIVMLATHPLRLRWVAEHYRRMTANLCRAIGGSFVLNDGAAGFYFQELRDQSPHKHPPVLSGGHGNVSIAVREFGWNEEFAQILADDSSSSDWLSALDDGSVDEMASVVEAYLQAHPHKQDGLSLLFISRDGESVHVERLVKRVLKIGSSEMNLSVYVVAPTIKHDEIARVLERLDATPRSPERLMPRLQTFLLGDAVLANPSTEPLGDRIDLAMVPNLFGTKTRILDQSRAGAGLMGRFDVLNDPTVYDQNAGDDVNGSNVSRALLPETSDPWMEAWSTLSVWRKAESPVTQGIGTGTDMFVLRVRFTESLQLFHVLHQWAHWVVTLDPFVNREQIESLERRPDIITVRPRVGKNGNYTLIVSSDSGRRYVVGRLARKLQHDLGVSEDGLALAERIYDNGRTFAPGVVMRALGLGRTAEELIGLIVARWSTIEQFAPCGCGELDFEAWLSLDEHNRWFGGNSGQRADLLRVVGSRLDGQLKISLQVLEAKFRQKIEIGTAEQQVERTLDIVSRVFAGRPSADELSEPADAPFWRRDLVDAIQQSSTRAEPGVVFAGLHAPVREQAGASRGGLSPQTRRELFEGEYEIVSRTGVICSIASSEEYVGQNPSTRETGQIWIRVGAAELRRILSMFARGDSPQPKRAPDLPAADASREHGRQEAQHAEDISAPSDASQQVVGIGERGLKHRYEQILDAFGEFGVGVDKPRDGNFFAEGPGFYQVRVIPRTGVRIETVIAQTNELKLRLELPAELSIRAFVDRGGITIQIPKISGERYFVDAARLWELHTHDARALAVPIGVDINGNPVSIEFSNANSPHMLIGGTTGSGKSVAMEAILAGLCHFYSPKQLRLKLIDPKGTELIGFEGSSHLEGEIGGFADDAISVLEQEVLEMERRYQLLRSRACKTLVQYNDIAEEALPWHVVVLDEYADLTAAKEDRLKIEAHLKRLSQKARAAGIHLIVATQKPSAEILSTSIRSNLPAQLALRVRSATDSRIIIEESGAESLAGKGDALLRTGGGVVRIQCAAVNSG